MDTTIDQVIQPTDPSAVERFVDQLATLHHVDWLAAGAVAECVGPPFSAAKAVLEALISYHGLGVEAWNAADDVQTAIFYSLGRKGFMPPRREATRLWAARAAARVAALAVLVRPLLTCSDFVTLYQPFASLVPAGAFG